MTFIESLPFHKKDQVKFFAQRPDSVTVEYIMNRMAISKSAAIGLIADNRRDGVKVAMRK